jgi:hypothetical protein
MRRKVNIKERENNLIKTATIETNNGIGALEFALVEWCRY